MRLMYILTIMNRIYCGAWIVLSSLLGVGTGNENKKLGKDWNTDNIDLMSFSSDYPKIHLIFINISAIIICNYNMYYLRQ